ncbi:tetratricopeptide repeat protein [Leifsonia xyli]|uniref:tetratricopeptide repeat protein n=1 Tax=Leifsonia xyli TaxID=1575 RepID=UPI003D675D4A
MDAYDVDTIGADVLFSIAMDLAPTGLEALVADLVETAIPDSFMLTAEPRFAGFAAAWLADTGRAGGAVALVEKAYLSESGKASDIPLVVFARDRGRLSGDAITKIADRVAEHASVQEGERAATEYYNAGNMLRPFNPRRALELHNLAAERHPDYKSRSYWWRDRGRISFNTGNLPDAINAYEQAVGLGDTEAIPLLADSYAANGEYAKAVETWDEMQVDEPRYLWRTRMLALQRLIPELGVEEQQRDLALAATMFDQKRPGIEILQTANALYPDALWVAGKQRADSEETGAFTFYFAAAAFGNERPMLWVEAIGAVHQVDDTDLRNYLFGLLLHAAVQECGDGFRHYVMSENVTSEAREFLLPLLDTIVVPDIDPFVLRFDGQAEQL